MVRVEKIVIQGFKSFKRKVSIPLPTGFSVITGPNGSGKTNILDAICFVLGKTSSRAMRAKQANELIFHGGRKKGGADYANVMMYFNNSGKELPFEEDSVSVGRRVNQSGVSTYRLNGKVVTRQQVVDVLSQIGIRPNGHNIIQQGDVTQIVEMDGVERRGVIDDISGIAEYDDKRNKAQKELGKIDEKVREAEIVLNEKEQILEKLRTERDAAMEHKKLNEDLEKIRATIVWKEFDKSGKSLDEIKQKVEEKEKESVNLEEEIRDYDSRIEEYENKMKSITSAVIKASSQIEVTRKLANLRSELEIKKERLESNAREIERIRDTIERFRSVSGVNPAVKSVLGFKGVMGTVDSLARIPKQYNTAVDVGAGFHLQDVVVDTVGTAVRCVKHLKDGRIGRARFLPMDKIQPSKRQGLPPGAIGWLSDLIRYQPQYSQVMNYVFGSTACIDSIDTAKKIAGGQARVRMVTLDGDLIEASGAVTGGFYRKRKARPETGEYNDQIRDLEKENEGFEKDMKRLRAEIEILAEKEAKTEVAGIEKDKIRLDEDLDRTREKRRDAYERRVLLQQEVGKLNIKRAKLEANSENLSVQWDQMRGEDLKEFEEKGVGALKTMEIESMERIEAIGPVNMKALQDFESIKTEFDEFKEKVDKIVEEKDSIMKTITEIESKRLSTFMSTLDEIAKHFKTVYSELTGGNAELALETASNIESGLLIKASPPGKKLLNIDSMSGGEKTLTAFAFLFAIQRHKPAPFYILDEADAALDKTNTKKIADLLRKQSDQAQFLIISHNDALVMHADQIYGVTMEDGESKVMGVKLPSNN